MSPMKKLHPLISVRVRNKHSFFSVDIPRAQVEQARRILAEQKAGRLSDPEAHRAVQALQNTARLLVECVHTYSRFTALRLALNDDDREIFDKWAALVERADSRGRG